MTCAVSAKLAFGIVLLAFAMAPARAGAKPDDRDLKEGKVQPLFGLDNPSDGPFPSDRFTVGDETQNTCERIDLRTDWGRDRAQDCSAPSQQFPNDCVEVGIINQLDGFNVRPRFAIPFSGELDLGTVDSESIYLVKLGNSLIGGAPSCMAPAARAGDGDDVVPAADAGWVVGIDQGVWDPETRTLHVEAAEVLDQHTRYVLFVTTKVTNLAGKPIEASKEFKRAIGDEEDDDGVVLDARAAAYRGALRNAVGQSRFFGLRRHDIAAATVFTTMSVTSVLEKIRAQIASAPVIPASFKIGPGGALAVFDLNTITGMTYNRQTSANERDPLSKIDLNAPAAPRLTTLRSVRVDEKNPAVAQIAVGNYQSPSYLQDRVLPLVGTYSGTPQVVAYESSAMVVFLPRGAKPANGWPVIIFGHGSADNLLGNGPFNVAGEYALKGFATVSINNVGAGFGPNTTLTVTRTPANGGPMSVAVFGRSVDVRQAGQANPDGIIGVAEGAQQGPPAGIFLAANATKQVVIHFMQLVRVLKAGIDIDGDGANDLDGSRLYYNGFSSGAHSGMTLFALEPDLRAATFTGLGSGTGLWKTVGSRDEFGTYLQNHIPPLINPGGTPGITCINPDGAPGITCTGASLKVAPPFFNDNLPVPGRPVLVNTVPGAVAIQNQWERFKWISNGSAPGSFAPYVRLHPLHVPARPFVITFAMGDQNVPNPETAETVEAGLLADRVTLYRHDLFANKLSFKNPHTFLIRSEVTINSIPNAMRDVALSAQAQVADFFASDGATTPDPDGAGALFETPASFIPAGTNYIP